MEKLSESNQDLYVYLTLLVIFFDVFISSKSIIQMRIIYDISFLFIVFPFLYVSKKLISTKYGIKRYYEYEVNNKKILILSLIINSYVIINTLRMNNLNIGYLEKNILVYGITNIMYIFTLLLGLLINGLILYFILGEKKNVYFYEIFLYSLGFISIEAFLGIYCFHIGKFLLFKYFIITFNILLIVINIYFYKKMDKSILIILKKDNLLLLLFGVGLFIMFYIPYGIYNIYGDSSIILNSVISISKRNDLTPFYISDKYYNPIGGFICLISMFMTGNNNILSCINYTFIISYIYLPFIIYHFINHFIIKDDYLAYLIVMTIILMDGLSIILLPIIKNNFSIYYLNWEVSPATKSLYQSSLSQIWFMPYKVFAMTSSIASCIFFNTKNKFNFLISGSLFSMAFLNPRQPFIAILLLIYLYGLKKIDIKRMIKIMNYSVIAFGPMLLIILYKSLEAIIKNIRINNYVSDIIFNNFLNILISMRNNYVILIIFQILNAALLFVLSKSNQSHLRAHGDNNKNQIDQEVRNKNIVSINMFYFIMSLLLIYMIIHAYNYRQLNIIKYINSYPLSIINYVINRYHIIMVLLLFYFIYFKHNIKNLLLNIALVLISLYGYHISPMLHTNIIFIIMAASTINYFIKSRKKMPLYVTLIFILFGIISGMFYAGSVTNIEVESRFIDLPHILEILVNIEPTDDIFCNSSYCYFVDRVVKMANHRLTSLPSTRYVMLDKTYTKIDVLNAYINNENYRMLFEGEVFVFFENK